MSSLTPNPSPIGMGEGSRQKHSDGRRPRAPGANSNIGQAARKLRRELTPSEQILWQALRNRHLNGMKFRRQHPAGRFVLDFYCDKERLAVEVDGGIHDRRKEADRERQEYFEAHGIRFVRIPAHLVEHDLKGAVSCN